MSARHDFRPEEFAEEFDLLEEVPGRWSVVGGMAVIIWAERYLEVEERARAGLGEPLVSKDLDIQGRRAHALMVRGLWGAQGQLQEFRWKDTGRHVWALASHPAGDPARRVVEVTEQVPGLSKGEGISVRTSHDGQHLHVLDPVSCLKAKVDVLSREMDANRAGTRKDARHVALLQAIVPRYLAEVAARPSPILDAERERARSVAPLAEAARLLAALDPARVQTSNAITP